MAERFLNITEVLTENVLREIISETVKSNQMSFGEIIWSAVIVVVPAVLVIIGAIWAMFNVSKKDSVEYGEMKSSFMTFKKNYGDMDCTIHNNRITKIELLLGKKGLALVPEYTETRSPRDLSEKGIELYEKSGGKKLIESNVDHLIGLINKRSPKTALDVQTLANMVLYDEMDNDIFIPVKDYIFNNPKFYENDIDLTTVCVVMSYPLRNLYLKRYPELNSSLH